MTKNPLIEVENLSKNFGGVKAVQNLNVSIREGELLGLIGPNGAGKTTFFNLLCGVQSPTSGKIIFQGENITDFSPSVRCKKGISRTYQILRILKGLTVLENVLIGALSGREKNTSLENAIKDSLKILEFVGLRNKSNKRISNINFFEKRLIEIARALNTEPKILLLDEPVSGLTKAETEKLLNIFKKINKKKGITIVLVEHVMKAIMDISKRIILLHEGEKLIEGSPEEVQKSDKAKKVYLTGGKYAIFRNK